MPFLQLQMSQTAVIHLSMPSGESSKIVPTLMVNCFLQPLQNHMRRVEMNECSHDPHRGHSIFPSGQRSVGIGEEYNRFLQAFRLSIDCVVHVSIVHQLRLCVK